VVFNFIIRHKKTLCNLFLKFLIIAVFGKFFILRVVFMLAPFLPKAYAAEDSDDDSSDATEPMKGPRPTPRINSSGKSNAGKRGSPSPSSESSLGISSDGLPSPTTSSEGRNSGGSFLGFDVEVIFRYLP
jgi:hypothetical protein